MNRANDGSLNRHGGHADMESNADAAARERAEWVDDKAYVLLCGGAHRLHAYVECPECGLHVVDIPSPRAAHIATCELLRERAEREVAAAEAK